MSRTYQGYLATFVSAAGFASFSLFLKLVMHAGVGVWTYTLLSSLGSLVILLVMIARQDGPVFPQIGTEWPGYFIFAACGAVSTIAFVLALVELSISLATMILFTYPAFVVLGNWTLFGVRPGRHHLIAVGLTLMGAAMTVNLAEVATGQVSPLGILYALLTAIAHGMYMVLGHRFAAELPAVSATTLTRIVICLAVLALFPRASLLQIPHINPAGWYLIALATLVTGVPPFLFLNVGVDRIGSNKAAVVSVVELPIAMGLGLLFEGERITFYQWLGAALIIAALLVSTRHTVLKKVR